MKIIIIAAVDNTFGIGKDNKIPWSIRTEMNHFLHVTRGFAVVMGSATWDSIHPTYRPLPQRRNYVLSRTRTQADFDPSCMVHQDLQSVVEAARAAGERHLFVIGGEQVYKQAMTIADVILLSVIPGDFVCDKFMPRPGPEWETKEVDPQWNSVTGGHFTLLQYERSSEPTEPYLGFHGEGLHPIGNFKHIGAALDAVDTTPGNTQAALWVLSEGVWRDTITRMQRSLTPVDNEAR